MAVTVSEEHQALGDWSLDLNYREDIAAELVDDDGNPRKVHVLVYDPDDELIYTGVLLRKTGGEPGLTIGGRGMGWWLAGPPIAEREFLSGANKLSNGDFSLGASYWTLPSDTVWTIADGVMVSAPRTPNPAIDPPGEPALDHNDIAVSQEQFSVSVGQELQATLSATRPGVDRVGRLWLRMVFGGHFKHRNIFPSFLNEAGTAVSWSFDTRSDQLGGMGAGLLPDEAPPGSNGRVLRVGPSIFREANSNPSFEEDDTIAVGWEVTDGAWTVDTGGIDGPNLIWTESVAARLKNDHDATTMGTDPYPVLPGEQWRFEVLVFPSSGPDATGKARYWTYWYHETDSAKNMWTMAEMANPAPEQLGAWSPLRHEDTVPEGYIAFSTFLATDDVGAGRWNFDHATALRVTGNIDYGDSPALSIVSGRSYTWRTLYRSENSDPQGEVNLCAIYYGPYKTTIVERGPRLEPTLDGNWERIAFTFTPPTGYDEAAIRVMSSDIQFGSYWIGEGELNEDDAGSAVRQEPSAWSGSGTVTLDAVAPEGATSVHLEVVAEREAIDWTVDNVTIRRVATPVTGDEVVESLLTDPHALSVYPGDLDCPEAIPYDWTVRNLSVRDALEHYCTVVSEPPREYRINPDRSIDVGTAETVFADHSPDSAAPIILLPLDIDVDNLDDVEATMEERATELVVIGAEHRSVNGTDVPLTAEAVVPGTVQVDWNGIALDRSRIVADSTIDHLGYAQALADDLAAAEADPPLIVGVTLKGLDTRPAFGVGDWIYVYDPASGLLDPENETSVDGEIVWPRRVRVLGRTRELGPSHRIDIRRTDGSTFTLPGVQWSTQDATSLTLGDRQPEWRTDPQGGDPGRQYLRDRASRPR